MSQKLKNATGLYMEGIRDGNAREAITKYTGERYTQHSTGVKDGVEGFLEFFEPFLERNPVRDIRVIRSVVDGQHTSGTRRRSRSGAWSPRSSTEDPTH